MDFDRCRGHFNRIQGRGRWLWAPSGVVPNIVGARINPADVLGACCNADSPRRVSLLVQVEGEVVRGDLLYPGGA